MKALIQVQVLTVGQPDSYENKQGETVHTQDAWVVAGKDARPIKIACDPQAGVKAGEAGTWEVDIYGSRFGTDLFVRFSQRVKVTATAA